MVPLGLWKDMRLPSFFSGVFFWPVSESKRGKVRITFMFLSPQLVTSCRFPAPWVDSSFVNSERASQPAIWAVSAGPLPLALSLPVSLSHTHTHSAVLTPSLSHRPLSLFLLLAHRAEQRQPPKPSSRLAPSVAYRGRGREQADLHQGTATMEVRPRRGDKDESGGRKVGARAERGWRRGKSSELRALHWGFVQTEMGCRCRNVKKATENFISFFIFVV